MIVVAFCSSSSSTITLRPRLSIQRTTPARSVAAGMSHCCAIRAATTSVATAAPSGASQPRRRARARACSLGLAPGVRRRQPQRDALPQLRSGRLRLALAQQRPQLGDAPQLALERGRAAETALEAPAREAPQLAVVVGVQRPFVALREARRPPRFPYRVRHRASSTASPPGVASTTPASISAARTRRRA